MIGYEIYSNICRNKEKKNAIKSIATSFTTSSRRCVSIVDTSANQTNVHCRLPFSHFPNCVFFCFVGYGPICQGSLYDVVNCNYLCSVYLFVGFFSLLSFFLAHFRSHRTNGRWRARLGHGVRPIWFVRVSNFLFYGPFACAANKWYKMSNK